MGKLEKTGAGDVRIFKEQYKIGASQWNELAPILCLSGEVELVNESDWWLDYCFDSLIQCFRKLGHHLTLGYLFQDEDAKRMNKMKKEDDYRPQENMAEFDRFFGLQPSLTHTWDYRNCELYLYRKTRTRRARKDGQEIFEAELTNFQSAALAQFETLKSSKYKDMYLVIGTYLFPVDSYMLSAQSLRFRRNFFQTQKSSGPLEIDDLTPRELEAFLVYIYCRTWPTYVMEWGRRPSKRFLEILKNYEVSLSIDKGDNRKGLSSSEDTLGYHECLVDTFLNDTFSPRLETDFEGEIDGNGRKSNPISMNSGLCSKKINTSTSSRWNFDFPHGFVYNNSLRECHPIEQNEDMRVKEEQRRKLLEDDTHCYTEDVMITVTSEWVEKQLEDF